MKSKSIKKIYADAIKPEKYKRTWPEKFFDAAHKDLKIAADRQEQARHDAYDRMVDEIEENKSKQGHKFHFVRIIENNIFSETISLAEDLPTPPYSIFVCEICGMIKRVKTWENK